VFIAHSYGSNYQLYGIVCTINGATITYGTDTQLSDVGYTGKTISLQLLPNGNVFIAHSWYLTNMYLYGMVVSINDTTISKGSDTVIIGSTSNSGYAISTCLLPNGNVFIAHSVSSSYHLHGIVVSINGTTITTGTDTALVSSTNAGYTISTCLLPNGKVFIAHSYGSNLYLYGMVVSISATTITKGSDTQLTDTNGGELTISTCLLPNGNVFIAHSSGGTNYYLYGKVCVIDGATITPSASVQLDTKTKSAYAIDTCLLPNGDVLISHSHTSGSDYYHLYGMIVNINNSTITKVSDTALVSQQYVAYGAKCISKVFLDNGIIFIAYSCTTSYYLYAQIFGIDYDNNIPTNNIIATEYETQVRKVTTAQFDGIAKTSGEGSTGYKEVEVEVMKTDNFFPISGWVKVSDTHYTTDSGYVLQSSSIVKTNSTTYVLTRVCDGDIGDTIIPWWSDYGSPQWVKMTCPKPIKATKMMINFDYNGRTFISAKIYGSKDDNIWTEIYSYSKVSVLSEEAVLTNTDYYQYYKVVFEMSDPYGDYGEVKVYEWKVLEYTDGEKEIQQVPSTEHKDIVSIWTKE
jgi:hypothetical protein